MAGVVSWALRFRFIVIIAAVVLSIGGVRFAADNLGINTDTANMIAGDLSWRESFDAYRNLFPVRDRNLVVVVESSDGYLSERVARNLAAKMRAESTLFPSVFLAGDGGFFARNGLLYLTVDELDDLSDRLVAAQPLLGQLAANPNGAGVLDVLTQAQTAAESTASVAALEPLQLAVASVFAGFNASEITPLDWSSLLGAAESPAARQLILIRPMLDFSRVRPAREAIDRLRVFIAESEAQVGEQAAVRLTGTVAMEHEELDSVVRSASLAGVLALLMVVLVLYWALRSVRLLVIAVASLLVGLIFTAALAAVTVGHLNLLSVAFAVLYVGLGVDFILHICLRVKEALAENVTIDSAITIALQNIGAALVICTLTTAAGFFAFVPSRLFLGISELGLISGTGMFVSFVVSITLLPALLGVFYRGRHGSAGAKVGLHVTRFAVKRARAVLAATVIIVALAAISLPRVYFDSNPVNLRDPNSESVVALSELAQDSEADMLTMAALFSDSAAVDDYAERFVELPEVRSVRSVAALIPENQEEKLFVLEDLAFVLGPGFSTMEYESADDADFIAAAMRLNETLTIEAPNSPVQLRLQEAVSRFVPEGNEINTRTAEFDRALFGNLADQLNRLEQALRADSFSVADLPPELLERWIADDGTELLEIVPQENIRDNDAAARFVSAVREVLPEATGLPVVYDEAARVIVTSFRQALTYAVIAIAAILLIFVRSVRDCMIVLIPISCAAIVTAGSTVWVGIPFNFANIIALPLLIGVGVDNAIHMLHRFRNSSSIEATAGSTSLAVFASGLTTIASFGNLAFSTHQGMATMGTLLTIGMIVMMAATLVFLPALLRAGIRS